MSNETKMGSKTPCKAIKPDGSQCQNAVQPQSDFCFFHDQSKAAERRAAQALGGRQNRAKTLDVAAPDVRIADCGDIVSLRVETINQVRKGTIDPRIANSVGYLANIATRVFEQRDIETRLKKLENLIEHRSQIDNWDLTGA